ncbi:MAG TPA: deoxynucleoside kinase [Kofleriaceae bacterium]
MPDLLDPSSPVEPIMDMPTAPAGTPSLRPTKLGQGSGPTREAAPEDISRPQAGAWGNIFIGIAGMIGAGKSTLAKALGDHLGIDTYYEPVADNEYLADFYRDTGKYSFAMQVYLLNRRFQQHQEIIWRQRSAVQDRTIYEDSIFAKMLAKTGLMDERDYRTYVQLFRNMSNFMCKPSVIVYLDVSPESSAARIEQRSRDVESKIPLSYLEALHEGYQEFLEGISKVIPVIRIDYEKFATAEEMAEVIKREYLDASFLRRVTSFDPAR